MTLLDTNVVLGSVPTDDQPALDVAHLHATMAQLGVGAAVVRHADAIHYDAATGNRELVRALAGHDDLYPAFVAGPLDAGEHGGRDGFAADLDRHGVRAVWLYPHSHGWSVTGAEAATLLDTLAACARPVFVDLDECGWDDVAQLARRLPDNDIVVCGIGYRTLRQAWAVLAAHERVRVDSSFLAANEGLEAIVRRFGAERVCFGTGLPNRDPGGARHLLALADVPADDLARIAADTACALLGVEPPVARPTPALPPPPSAGIVDAHAHIGLWPSGYLPAPGPDDLVAGMERTGTSIAIVSAMRALWTGDVRPGNAEALAAAQSHPGRIFMHAVANPHHVADRAHLEELLDLDAVRGIKVHPHTHGCAIDDARYDWIFDVAARRRTPVLGHCFAGTWHSDPAGFARVADRHPDVVLVAGHAGANPDGYRAVAALGSTRPNMYAEICGTAMSGRWLRLLVDELGAERVLYGTDTTLLDPRIGLGRVLHSDLSEHERDLVLGANARRIYDLDPPQQ